MKIPKTILQTSKLPYPSYVNDLWKERIDSSWTINWFDDRAIYKFFEDNPLPEFPKIKEVFDSFSDGGHRADLFRYYYLYLNGGFFIDSDVMFSVHMDEIYSSNHDHVLVSADLECNRHHHPEIDSPVIFNGIMGCIPKSQIVYEALKNAYNVKPRLLDKQRLYLVYDLYLITQRLKHQYNILFFNERLDTLHAPYSYTVGTDEKVIAKHFYVNKVIPKQGTDMDFITFFTTFNEEGYILYGRAWVRTFINAIGANRNIKARIYCEGFKPDIHHDFVEYVDFAEAIPEHRKWKVEYLKYTKHMKYTKDMTVRFSHKAFVIQHAIKNPSTQFMVWLDGDCIFKPSEYSSFASSLTGGKLLACQVESIEDTPISHVESGVLIFDTDHPDLDTLVDAYKFFYTPKELIKMPNDNCDTKGTGNWQDYGPYDGFILHKSLVATGIDFQNLNSTELVESPVATPDETFHHPELNSRFVHNIGHAGKLEYMKLNDSLGIAENFEWSHHQTNELSNLDRVIKASTEVVTASYRGVFPMVIHTPEIDTVVSGDIYLYQRWEEHIADIIVDNMKPNGIFVDIGANIGWHSKVVQNAGYDVIAFEPLALNFDVLKQNCEKQGSQLFNIGLGNERGSFSMNINPHNYGDSWISETGTTTINVERLDDILDVATAQRVDVVKMDVQGFETLVLEGGLNFFDSLRPGTTIVFEVSLKRPLVSYDVIVNQLLSKSTSSYALCFWHNNKPVSFDQAVKDIHTHKEWDEFDLIITK